MARGVLEDVEEVCRAERVPLALVLSPLRYRSIATARHAVMRRLRERGLSYPEIGWLMGRDHTTVLAACREKRP